MDRKDKPYETPALTRYGKLDELTHGSKTQSGGDQISSSVQVN